MTPGRRELVFASLVEITSDVERLLAGHRTVGRWTLAQICNHLAMAFRGSVEGVPFKLAPWYIRWLIAPLARRSIFKKGRIPEGVWIPERAAPVASDARAEADSLAAALAFFELASGTLAAHPLMGRLTREQWVKFHLVHSAHHLSFAIPMSPVANARGSP